MTYNKEKMQETIMKIKDYWGLCGSCIFCDLSDGETVESRLEFKCMYYDRRVEAHDQICRKYKLKQGRSNQEIIAFINTYQ